MVFKAIKEWIESWLVFAWLWFLYVVSSEKGELQRQCEIEANRAYLHFPEKRVVSGREVYLQTVLTNSSVKPIPKKDSKRSRKSSVNDIVEKFERTEPSSPEIKVTKSKADLRQTRAVDQDGSTTIAKVAPILCKRSEILGHGEEIEEDIVVEPCTSSDNTDSLWEELVSRYAAEETAKECDELKTRLGPRIGSFERTDSVKSEEEISRELDGKLQKYLSRIDDDYKTENKTRDIEVDYTNTTTLCQNEEEQIFIMIDDGSDSKDNEEKTASESFENYDKSDFCGQLKSYETKMNLAEVSQVSEQSDYSTGASELLVNENETPLSCGIEVAVENNNIPSIVIAEFFEDSNISVEQDFDMLCGKLDDKEKHYDRIMSNYIDLGNLDEIDNFDEIDNNYIDNNNLIVPTEENVNINSIENVEPDLTLNQTGFELGGKEIKQYFIAEMSTSSTVHNLDKGSIEAEKIYTCQNNFSEKDEMHFTQTSVDSYSEIVDMLPESNLQAGGTMCHDTFNEEVPTNLEVAECNFYSTLDHVSIEGNDNFNNEEIKNKQYITYEIDNISKVDISNTEGAMFKETPTYKEKDFNEGDNINRDDVTSKENDIYKDHTIYKENAITEENQICYPEDTDFAINEKIDQQENETMNDDQLDTSIPEKDILNTRELNENEINNMSEDDLSKQIEIILKGLTIVDQDDSDKNAEQRLADKFNPEFNEEMDESISLQKDDQSEDIITPDIMEEMDEGIRCHSPQLLEQDIYLSDNGMTDEFVNDQLLVNNIPDEKYRRNSKFSLADIPEENEIDEELTNDNDFERIDSKKKVDQNDTTSCSGDSKLPANDIPEYLEDVKDLLIPRARRKKAKKFKELEDILKVDKVQPIEIPANIESEKTINEEGNPVLFADEEATTEVQEFHRNDKDNDSLANFTEEEKTELREIKEEQKIIRSRQLKELEKYLSMPCSLTEQEQFELQDIIADEESEKIITAASEARLMSFLSDVRNRLGHYSDDEDTEDLDDFRNLPLSLTKIEEQILSDDDYEVNRNDFATDNEYEQYIKNKYLEELEEDRLRVEEEFDDEHDYEYHYSSDEYEMGDDDDECLYKDQAVGTETNSKKLKKNKLKNYLSLLGNNSSKTCGTPKEGHGEPISKDKKESSSQSKFFRYGSLGKRRKKTNSLNPIIDASNYQESANVINENIINKDKNSIILADTLQSEKLHNVDQNTKKDHSVFDRNHIVYTVELPNYPDGLESDFIFNPIEIELKSDPPASNIVDHSFPLKSVENIHTKDSIRSQQRNTNNQMNPFLNTDHTMSAKKGLRRLPGSEVVSSIEQDSLECLSSVSPACTSSPSLSPNPKLIQQNSLQESIEAELASRFLPNEDSLEELKVHESGKEVDSVLLDSLETSNFSLDSLSTEKVIHSGIDEINTKLESTNYPINDSIGSISQNGHDAQLVLDVPAAANFSNINNTIEHQEQTLTSEVDNFQLEEISEDSLVAEIDPSSQMVEQYSDTLDSAQEITDSPVLFEDTSVSLDSVQDLDSFLQNNVRENTLITIDHDRDTTDENTINNYNSGTTISSNSVRETEKLICESHNEKCDSEHVENFVIIENEITETSQNGFISEEITATLDSNYQIDSFNSSNRFNDANINAGLISRNDNNVIDASVDVRETDQFNSVDASVSLTNDEMKSPMLDEFEKLEKAVEENEKQKTNGVSKKRKDGEKKKKKKKKTEAEKENKKNVIQSRDGLYEKHVGPRIRSFDTAKMKSKFNKPKESCQVSTDCRICGKEVFQMEKIVAEKGSWHKNCFRCTECNKQMTTETYQSHEGTLYCKPHFKELFRPKAVVQDEDAERKDRLLRRPRMIVLESQPEALPEDVIRATQKPDYGLEELQSLNMKQRFSMFENADKIDDSPKLEQISVQRSQSMLSKTARFLGGDEYKNGVEFDEEDEYEDEEDLNGEVNGVVKSRKKIERPMSFSGIGDLKNAWEQKHRREEMTQARKEEVGRFRQLLCAGKNSTLKDMFESGKFDNEDDETKERVRIEVKHAAKSLRERFEKGQPFILEDDEERNGRENGENSPDTERREVEQIFKEAETAKKARNVFKEIDSVVSKEGAPVMRSKSFAQAPKDNRNSRDVSFLALQMSPSTAEVIKATEKLDDFKVDTTDLASRFKFFSTYEKELEKEQKKAKKVFRMTPPREGTDQGMTVDDIEVGRDPNLIKCTDKYEDDVDCRNTKNILQMFRKMEMAKEEEEGEDAPRPLKSFTPPPDGERYDDDSGEEDDDDEEYSDEEYTDEDSEGDDRPKYKDEILEMLAESSQSAKKAAQLRAKFERYESEIERSNSQDQENEECRPSLDTARNLTAMFENKAVEVARPVLRTASAAKVNRFV